MCCFGQEPASGPDAVDRRGFSFSKQMGRAGPMAGIVCPPALSPGELSEDFCWFSNHKWHQFLYSHVLNEASSTAPLFHPFVSVKCLLTGSVLFYYFRYCQIPWYFLYDFLHCFCTCYWSNNNDGLFTASYLFNAFLIFLIVFFLLFYFSHGTYLGFIEECGITWGSKLNLFQRTNFPNAHFV